MLFHKRHALEDFPNLKFFSFVVVFALSRHTIGCCEFRAKNQGFTLGKSTFEVYLIVSVKQDNSSNTINQQIAAKATT